MTSSDVAFKVKFDRTNSPANFELEDTADYAGLGINPDDVRGNFTSISDPLGNVIHANTDYASPDIAGASSLLYTGLDIPTDADDDILEGQYSFTYGVKIDAPITAVTAGASGTFTIAGTAAVAALITADDSITVVRSTGNNGTYNVASAIHSGGSVVITITGTVPSGVLDGSIQYASQEVYTKTSTVTYEDAVPAVSIEVLVDCFCGTYTSNDKTDYTDCTIVSRTHTVKYPAALNKADVTSSGATVLVTPIYTKTWTSIIETELTVDLGSGNTISAIITGSKDTKVECDLSLCDISCCLLAMDNRYQDQRVSNPTEAEKTFKALTRMIQLVAEFRMFYECDQHDAAADCVAEIKKVGNCTDACSCSDDEPAQVIPICGSNGSNIQVTQGSGIVVTTSYQNSNYVYQISLAPSILALINSATPVSVTGGTGITVTSAVVGGVTVYTVTNTATYTAQNRMEFQCRIQFSTAGPTVTVTPSAYLYSGSNMNSTVTAAAIVAPGSLSNNGFDISAFQVVPNTNYKVTIEPILISTLQSNTTLRAEVYTRSSGSFRFRLTDANGLVYSSAALVYGADDELASSPFSDIIVNVKISE